MGAPNNFGLTLPESIAASVSRMNAVKASIMQSIRVSVPAIVQSFNPGPPATVVLQVALKEYVQKSDPTGLFNPVTDIVALPLLSDVPVVFPTGGGWSLTLPIQPGDECLAVFSDAALDAWLQSGGIDNAPISQRRHSLSDAMAVFGLRSTPNGLDGYSTDSMQIRSDDGTVVIDLADDQITITAPTVVVNAQNVTLGSSTTVDKVKFLTHTHSGVTTGGGVSGPPVVP